MPALASGRGSPLGAAFTYAALVGIPAALVLAVLRIGSRLDSATGAAVVQSQPAADPSFDFGLLILQIVVVVAAARLVGSLLQRLGQPRVVGEMLAGIVLGPSLLGHIAPALSEALFPASTLVFLNSLAQIGLLLFMFQVGLELDSRHFQNRQQIAVVTSHASIVAPFLLGSILSLLLYSEFAPAGVAFAPFALFMGAAMSVTAFPVLARILSERKMTNTPLGAVAIACAAVDDVTAWCILAAVAMVARSGAGDLQSLLITIAGTIVYIVFMFTVGKRLLMHIADRAQKPGAHVEQFLAGVMLITLVSAWITERLGIHALFGAFLVGALVPRGAAIAAGLSSRMRDLMVVLFLPLYFAFTGLRTTITFLSSPSYWTVFGLILSVAILGKLGGSAIAARATGMSWRDSLSLGTLMNTRGLMELVILNVGLDIGVLTQPLFAMMVMMAMITTAMTTPALNSLQRVRQTS